MSKPLDTDTSALDEKRGSIKKETFLSDIISFVIFILLCAFALVIYFGISSLLLYSCKVGQSNVLPTLSRCFPYTDLVPNIIPVKCNIFTTYSEPSSSVKINIPYYGSNKKNSLLELFLNYKKDPDSSFLVNYFISIFESILHANYEILNKTLTSLNELPEYLIVLFGPIILTLIYSFLFLIDYLYAIYLFFANMSWFFKYNSNNTGTGQPKWDDVTFSSPTSYVKAICLALVFLIVFLFGGGMTLALVPIVTVNFCILSCFLYKGVMYDKEITSLGVMRELFKYYKTTFTTIFSIFVILGAFSNLGIIPGIFSIITIALIYFGIIGIGIFKTEPNNFLTPVVSFSQAKKTCRIKESPGGFLNIFGGQHSGNIVKELKAIGKSLHNA